MADERDETFSLTVRENDVWLNFKASTGRQASISIAAMARERSGIVGMALREWAADEIARAALERAKEQTP